MPIYEYICQCGNKFDRLNPVEKCSDTEKCPRCGQKAQRRMSVFSWYMGWKHLANVKSEPAPNDSGYHKKWDD